MCKTIQPLYHETLCEIRRMLFHVRDISCSKKVEEIQIHLVNFATVDLTVIDTTRISCNLKFDKLVTPVIQRSKKCINDHFHRFFWKLREIINQYIQVTNLDFCEKLFEPLQKLFDVKRADENVTESRARRYLIFRRTLLTTLDF